MRSVWLKSPLVARNKLEFVNFSVDVLTPSFRNGSIKSGFLFELVKLTKKIV